ncbi:MAG: GspH/FimT family pseudopilin [Kiritimatiellaeota bacterium]|nr:GspH/FimT family pseudopilin [Kiritimatiellota bacterium]
MTRRSQRGFTLIEILMVVAIFVLIAGIAAPMFVGSYAGAKLRTSARAVIMTSRYARNMAVMRQRPVAMIVDQQRNTFEVVLLTGRESETLTELTVRSDDENTPTFAAAQAAVAATNVDVAATNADAAAEDKATSDMLKGLPDGISIDSFECQRPGSDDSAAPRVIVYYPSGLSDGFTIRLADERGRSVEINADPLTGEVTTEFSED